MNRGKEKKQRGKLSTNFFLDEKRVMLGVGVLVPSCTVMFGHVS
jgi:hypothetical protein